MPGANGKNICSKGKHRCADCPFTRQHWSWDCQHGPIKPDNGKGTCTTSMQLDLLPACQKLCIVISAYRLTKHDCFTTPAPYKISTGMRYFEGHGCMMHQCSATDRKAIFVFPVLSSHWQPNTRCDVFIAVTLCQEQQC